MNKSKKKTILVTGATGFIGRHLTRRLIELDEYKVVAITRYPEKAKELESKGIKVLKADITKKADLRKLNEFPIDIIIHCAACVESKNPKVLNKVNIEGTENICKLAVELGVEKLIYLSSVAVVSGNKQVPLTEDLPFRATSPYGQSKLEAEKKALVYRRKGVPVIILRPPIVYGEDEPHAFSPLLKLIRHRLLPLPNKGKVKLHLAYVENVVAAIIFSLKNENMFEGAFFVADKEVLTVYQVFKNMSKGLGVKAPFRLPNFSTTIFCNLPFAGKRLSFFLKNRAYSTEKIESLGFHPPYRAEEALARSCRVYIKDKIKRQ